MLKGVVSTIIGLIKVLRGILGVSTIAHIIGSATHVFSTLLSLGLRGQGVDAALEPSAQHDTAQDQPGCSAPPLIAVCVGCGIVDPKKPHVLSMP